MALAVSDDKDAIDAGKGVVSSVAKAWALFAAVEIL